MRNFLFKAINIYFGIKIDFNNKNNYKIINQ